MAGQRVAREHGWVLGWRNDDGTPPDRFKSPALAGAGGMYREDCHQGGGRYLNDCPQREPAEPGNRVRGCAPHTIDVEWAQRLRDVSQRMLDNAH